ncbi:MAG: hypothetical protein Q9166_003371 [cf. Caloplaca sp. 2 TL-2023]
MQHEAQSANSRQIYSSLVNAQYSAPPTDLEDEVDKQAKLDQIREQQYRKWPKSKYSDVSVLLLRWAADNLGVIDEVLKLRHLLQSHFNFSTEIWDIPSEDPEDALTTKILGFRKGKGNNSLIMLYYAGHGGEDPGQCIWAANHAPDSPWLNWHNVQGLLLGHSCDTLFVLDCCYASLAANAYNTGDNWFLGASVKESEATGVSWKSFTSAMTRKLERAAHKYWADRESYNVQTLNHDLNLREQDLPVTPILLRLTSQNCEPTDLTPLLYPRARPKLASARTEPVVSQTNEKPRLPSLPQRPRDDHATSPSAKATPHMHRQDDKTQPQIDIVPIEISILGDCQTVRLSGLPWNIEADNVADWVGSRLRLGPTQIRVGPIVWDSPPESGSTIVCLPNVAKAKEALGLRGKDFSDLTGLRGNSLTVDTSFQGLTTIYVSPTTLCREPTADIVFVHGAYGHPINSFASHYVAPGLDRSSIEKCWPRDELPKLLEAMNIFPRVLTYGWQAKVWLSPSGKVSQAANDFRSHLQHARLEAPNRPLIFIGHGLGGILIKDAVNSTIYADLEKGHFETPVKLCCFLATPQREVDQHGDFASVLAAMGMLRDPPSQLHPLALQVRNPTLRSVSSEFDALRNEYGISLLSAAESEKTKNQYVVPEEAAVLSETFKDRIEFRCNHRDLARLPDSVTNRSNGLRVMCDRISERLNPRSHHLSEDPSSAKKRERVYGRLRKYDTVFLVDDSESMYGRRWYTASKVLADVATIAVKYDKDGVDLQFFNERLEDDERKNIDTPEKVMEIFLKVQPNGPTLTADLLEEELNEYMYEYRQNRSKKGLNLIILTDGEPERGQNVEKVIVKYANLLRNASAPLFHVGIQFVQIGADSAATKFLKYLDTKLKGKRDLDRDMVDTVHWVPGDEERLVEKILLGGILKQLDNEDESEVDDETNSGE